MARERIRVGIVGVGWGALVHAPAFRAVPEFELVALCSRQEERVRAAGQRLGIGDLATDWRSFVQRDDLDLISVTTPVGLHVDVSTAALAAGKHVLCEKPIALSAVDARRLYEAGLRSGKATALCHETRWLPQRLAIWERVRAGYLGEPYYARIVQSAGYWHPSHGPQSEWMYRLGEGGGYIMGLQSHDIDYMTALFGAPVAVCADLKTTVKRRQMADGTTIDVDADDTGNLLLRFASGVTVALVSSVVGLHTSGQAIDLFGSEGTILMERDGTLRAGNLGDTGLSEFAPSAREPRAGAIESKGRSSGMIRAQALMLEDWLPTFEGQPTPSIPSFADGLMVAKVIEAARTSSAGAGWVEITPEA